MEFGQRLEAELRLGFCKFQRRVALSVPSSRHFWGVESTSWISAAYAAGGLRENSFVYKIQLFVLCRGIASIPFAPGNLSERLTERRRDGVCRVSDRVCGKMSVACCRLNLRVAQQLADHR